MEKRKKIKLTLDEPKVETELKDFEVSLYDIHKSFDVIECGGYSGIKGEFRPRMAVFTSYVLGKKPFILLGQRASGKSNILNVVCDFYCRNPLTVSSASEKADIRDSDKLNEATHFIIPEINKISNHFLEVLKDIGEGKASVYKTINEFKKPITFKIQPKPFITCLADENDSKLSDELISRLITVSLNCSIQQNKEVIAYKLERAQNPYARKEVNKTQLKKFQKYVKNLPGINEFTFIYPMGKSIMSAIPPLFTDSRRDCDKYLENTYGITLFHFKERLCFEKKNKKNIIVTPADAWLNHIIFSELLISSALKCNQVETLIVKTLRTNAKNNPITPTMKLRDIHATLVKSGLTPSTETVRKYCKNLYKNGYLIENDECRPLTYEVSDFFMEFKANINWERVVEESKRAIKNYFPEIADEYIRKYCKKEIKVIHPFTGEEVDIMKWTEKKLEVIKEEVGLQKFNKIKEESIKIEEEAIVDDNEKNWRDYVKQKQRDDNLFNALDFEETFGIDFAEKLIKEQTIFEAKPGWFAIL